MTAARQLAPAAPTSQTRAVTPLRRRLLDEIDTAIAIRKHALALAEERLRCGSNASDAWARRGAVDDLRGGLDALRAARAKL